MSSTKDSLASCANCVYGIIPAPEDCSDCWVDEDQFPSGWVAKESMIGKMIELRRPFRKFFERLFRL